ncbi:uncharacterized protein [Argopecten irradians]|uniref:uncharacterized protein n=1 Tax=Argopecten irradians TaxID=31199 RepID=UPI0037142392
MSRQPYKQKLWMCETAQSKGLEVPTMLIKLKLVNDSNRDRSYKDTKTSQGFTSKQSRDVADDSHLKSQLNKSLKNGVTKGTLKPVKGSFRLAEKPKAAKKPKAVAKKVKKLKKAGTTKPKKASGEKKAKSPKKAKKPAAKKSKKAAKPKKAPTPKKAKKPSAKKPAAKKTA